MSIHVTFKSLIDAEPFMGAWLDGLMLNGEHRYRYALWRVWDRARPLLVVCMLNPSKADARKDDHTVRRIVFYAKRDGYGGILVVNMYALRATDPDDLWKRDGLGPVDIVGPLNDAVLKHVAGLGTPILCAWGSFAKTERVEHVVSILRGAGRPDDAPLLCLGLTKDGHPHHPARLSNDERMWHYPKGVVYERVEEGQ